MAEPGSVMTSLGDPQQVALAGSSQIEPEQCHCDDASRVNDMCAECAKRRGAVQRYATQAGGPAQLSPSVTRAIKGSSGERLPEANRAHMESALGADLTGVRVHKGPDAANAADDINARAFAVGQDIYFGAGQYDPGTKRGSHLLAHELTHTLQQAGGDLTTQADTSVSSPGDPLEREAEAVASSIGDPREPAPQPQRPLRPQLTTRPMVQSSWYDPFVAAGEWVGGKVEEGAEAAWRGAKWVGGKVEEGAEAAWRGAKRVGGWLKDEAVRVGGAAWECLKITGGSIGDLLTGHLPTLRELLDIPKPADDSPIGVMDVIMGILRHPCVRMIPGYPLFAKAASRLQEVYGFLKGAWALVQDPDRITSAIRDALAPKMSDVAGRSRELVEKALASSPILRKHLAGIWRHLEPKLEEFGANWWAILKETAWDLVWPWPGVGKDLGEIWAKIKDVGSDIWALDIDSAVDDMLAIWRKANVLIGRLYGWFFIASILIGAIVGAFFGGAGAIPGAIAGFEFALAVGEGLLISTVAAEGLTIAKAVFDLSGDEQTEKKNDEDYKLIANSSLTLGIIGILYLLGAIAARFARGVMNRVARLFRRSAEPPPPGLPRAPEPARVPEGEPGAAPKEEPGAAPKEEPAEPLEEGLGDGVATDEDVHPEDLSEPRPANEPELDPAICFPAGTPVATPSGPRPIEQLRPGDEVLSFDHGRGEIVVATIADTTRGWTSRWVQVDVGSTIIRATGSHRFWVSSKRDWCQADDLLPGMTLLTRDGRVLEVRDVSVHLVESGWEATYNLSIPDIQNYFASSAAVLVHNITKSRYLRLSRAGYRNYVLVNSKGEIYYSGMFGPDVKPEQVEARHAANHDRFNPAKGDRMKVRPGTREYGEARLTEQRVAEANETIKLNKPKTYRCNRQNPLAEDKAAEYQEYLEVKRGCA
jgi:hypothetical protein